MKLDLPKEREFDAGVWYSTPASSLYPSHCHDELELNVVVCGRALVAIDAHKLDLGPGSLLWLAPGQSHELLSVSPDYAMWVVSIRPQAARAAENLCAVRFLNRPATWGACHLGSARLAEMSSLCAAHLHHDGPKELNPLSHRTLKGALQAWQEELDRSRSDRPLFGHPFEGDLRPAQPCSDVHPAVARARTLLCNAADDLQLENLSRSCGLSAPWLSRLFKRQMGLSTVQFRNHYRVQRFIARFGDGQTRTMLDIALDVGFGSYPQFHRAFRQVTGYAPSEHLRRVRAGIVDPSHQVEQTAG